MKSNLLQFLLILLSVTWTCNLAFSFSTRATLEDCSCGTLDDAPNRIVQGTIADEHSIPWQVGITMHQEGNATFCGASIIDPCYVLTAAHCINDATYPFYVTIGDHNANEDTMEAKNDHLSIEITSSSQVKVHERFNGSLPLAFFVEHDLALIKLDPCLTNAISDWKRVCLPRGSFSVFNGELATVSGWGATATNGTPSTELKKAFQTILSDEHCKSFDSTNFQEDHMICANGVGGPCFGDGGGPLTVVENSKTVLVGVVSYPIPITVCDSFNSTTDAPSVYMSVAKALHWIRENTPSSKCI